MTWIRLFCAAIVTCSMTVTVQAGLFDFGGGKSSGCANDCQPSCCTPTIVRPCWTNVYTHQRKSSKPSCCNTCCAPSRCCAPTECCAPPQSCTEQGAFCPAPVCGENSCCVPTVCPQEGCGSTTEDCSKIAKLIYQSMTACYARDRKSAIHKLGDYFDCCCHPEIMNAFIYALNDSDERVRAKAADEIGDQIRRNRCCVGSPTISALTCALADCDRSVRRQAEEALLWSGYKIVDKGSQNRSCQTCGPGGNGSGTVWGSGNDGSTTTTTAPIDQVPPAPSPTETPDLSQEPLPEVAPSAPAEAAAGDAPTVYENTPPLDAGRLLPTVDEVSDSNPTADPPSRVNSRTGAERIRAGLAELMDKVR